MNVLSLFDGISCGRIALEMEGIPVEYYFASEIKQHAIDLVKKRFPNTIHLGDVRKIHYTNIGLEVDLSHAHVRFMEHDVHLLIGGSPCKGGSQLNKKRNSLDHEESSLFYEYVRILKELRMCGQYPYFLLENVAGNKEFIATITRELGVRPIKLNSKLVSAQNRRRLYWTNIPVTTIPENKRITTADILDNDMPQDLICSEGRTAWLNSDSGKKSIKKEYTRVNPFPKAACLTARGHVSYNENYIKRNGVYRFLSVRELERLQTIPEGYCDGLSYDEASDVIGDGWTIDIIRHIFQHIPKQ